MENLIHVVTTRTIPGVGTWDEATKSEVATKSVAVSDEINKAAGKTVHEWIGSVATGPNELTCHHRMKDLDTGRQHSADGGFPHNESHEVGPDYTLPRGLWAFGPGNATPKAD